MSSLSSLDVSSTLLICNDTKCMTDDDHNTLVCIKCMRLVHYECSKLPAYQIHVINTKRHYPFYCKNCVDVPQSLLNLVPSNERTLPEKEIERLKREVAGCEALIEHYEESEKKLKAHIDNSNTLNDLEDKMDKKLESLKECLLSTIKQECKDITKSYADTTKSNILKESNKPNQNISLYEFKNVIRNVRKEELSEELEQKRRSSNIVIHVIPENSSVTKDKKWVNNLKNDLHTRVEIKSVSRIGVAKNDKKRPIMVVLKSEDDKQKFLSNLKVLHGIDKYKGVTISEDLTQEQRKNVKDLSQEAMRRNNEEKSSSSVWRVRGSSKNGFYLKCVMLDTCKLKSDS